MHEMNILCVGLSYRTAPLALRERLCYTPASLSATLARFGCGHDTRPVGFEPELAIISTCNRLELYATSEVEDFEPLIDLIAETSGVARADFAGSLYAYAGEEAARHLCRVAAGLDSMVLGEPQILGQVTEAYSTALGHASAGATLSVLMRTAIHAGKRARTETAISRNPATISSIAVKLAEEIVDLAHANVLIVGSGEMAELAMSTLHSRGVQKVTVVSRTHENAVELAERVGGHTATFEHLEEALADADIVITSTAAPHVIVQFEMVQWAMTVRAERPLVFVDIAVPRDVDPAVTSIPNVRLYDIDDLQGHLNTNVAVRQSEVPQVEAIVEEEARGFMDWVSRLHVTPVIADLRAHAETIRRTELEKTLRQLAHLTDADRNKIDALTQALLNKILHEPTVRLKAEATNGRAEEYAAAVSHLFGLPQ
jgi:glutamyl-tRNA reductase